MDPITLSILGVLLLGGGGFFWYEKFGPGSKPAAPAPARQITLDANLPATYQQTVIAAIMTQTDAATLTGMAAQYTAYPWAAYELSYRAWELNGSTGTAPTAPTTAGTTVPTSSAPVAAASTTPAVPATTTPPLAVPSQLGGVWSTSSAMPPPVTAGQAAAAATPGATATPIPPPGVVPQPDPALNLKAPPPSAGPFDLSAATTSGAWQTNSAFIKAYQGALTFLAYKFSTPAWDPQGVDGVCGADTMKAVMAFQGAKGLSPVDGEVGPATATAMASALTATSTAGQGSYAAFPADGDGPGDSRYGAQGRGLKDQVHGRGEDEVQGVAGMGEDQVQGRGEDQVQGLGEDQVQGVLKKQAAQAVGAALAAPMPAPTARPRGGWFVKMRETDRVWPRKLAEIGSGVSRGPQGAAAHLADLNPHLAPGGVLRQFAPGDEVNIPGDWATNLTQKGFDVRPDPTEGLL